MAVSKSRELACFGFGVFPRPTVNQKSLDGFIGNSVSFNNV